MILGKRAGTLLSLAGPEREEALRGRPAGGAKDDPRGLRVTPGGTKLSNAALSRQLAPCTPRAWQPFGSRDGPEAREAGGALGARRARVPLPPVREEPPALRGGEGSAPWPSFLRRRVALLSDPKKGNVCRRLCCCLPARPSRAPARGRPLAAGLEEPQETRLPPWGAVRSRPGPRGCLQAELRDVTGPDCSFLAKLNGFDVLLLCWKCLALGEENK